MPIQKKWTRQILVLLHVKQKSIRPNSPGARMRKLSRKDNRIRLKRKYKQERLPPAYTILWWSVRHMLHNWKLFGGILLVYGILLVLFVRGLTASTYNLGALRTELSALFTSGAGLNFALLGILLSSAGQTSGESGNVYRTIVLIIISLALIWALRHSMTGSGIGKKLRVRDSFYCGMYPLIPFAIVLFVIVLQCLPLLVSAMAYVATVGNGLSVAFWERMLWTALLVFGALTTAYWLGSSVFAMYIVTLTNTAPLAALRTARRLVKYRRFTILRKVLFLPFVLLLISTVVILPLIIFIAPAAVYIYVIGLILALGLLHAYMYTLYRELL